MGLLVVSGEGAWLLIVGGGVGQSGYVLVGSVVCKGAWLAGL